MFRIQYVISLFFDDGFKYEKSYHSWSSFPLMGSRTSLKDKYLTINIRQSMPIVTVDAPSQICKFLSLFFCSAVFLTIFDSITSDTNTPF